MATPLAGLAHDPNAAISAGGRTLHRADPFGAPTFADLRFWHRSMLSCEHMAEYELRAGAHIDLITPDEQRKALEPLERELQRLVEKDHYTTQRVSQTFTTTGSGADPAGGYNGSGVILYTVPPGYCASVHRVYVNVGGANPGTPLTTGSWGLYRNSPQGDLFGYAPGLSGGTTQVAPVVLTWGTHDAQWLEGGERVVIAGAGLTDSAITFVYLQARLFRNPRELPHRQHRDEHPGIDLSVHV